MTNRDAGLDQPPRHQHPRTGRVAAVFVTQLGRLGGDVERLAGLGRADHRIGALIERVDRLERIGLLLVDEIIVDRIENPPPPAEAAVGHAAGKLQVLHREAGVRRVAPQAERRERGAQVAGPGVFVRHAGNADVLRQIVLRRKFVRHDAAHAGKGERRARLVAGEHVVRAALVRRFAVSHRAAKRDLVAHFGRLHEMLVEHDPIDVRRDRAHRSAVLDRRVRLGVERFLMRSAARQEDEDNRLGLSLLALVVL